LDCLWFVLRNIVNNSTPDKNFMMCGKRVLQVIAEGVLRRYKEISLGLKNPPKLYTLSSAALP